MSKTRRLSAVATEFLQGRAELIRFWPNRRTFLGVYTYYEGAVRSLLTKATSTATLD